MMQIRDLLKLPPGELWYRAKRRVKSDSLKYNFPLLPRTLRSRYGPRLVTRRNDATFRFCIIGSYGTFLSDYLAGISNRFVFLDIGANIGLFSLLAAANEHCVSVQAFEPIPMTYRFLVENCEVNKVTQVSAYCGAITSCRSGMVSLSYNACHSGAAHLVDERQTSERNVSSLAIGSATLNELLERFRPSRIVAKIDVEGAELDVIRTLKATNFCDQISDVFVEVSEMIAGRTGVDALYAALSDLGYDEVSRSSLRREHYDAHFRRRSACATPRPREACEPKKGDLSGGEDDCYR